MEACKLLSSFNLACKPVKFTSVLPSFGNVFTISANFSCSVSGNCFFHVSSRSNWCPRNDSRLNEIFQPSAGTSSAVIDDLGKVKTKDVHFLLE